MFVWRDPCISRSRDSQIFALGTALTHKQNRYMIK